MIVVVDDDVTLLRTLQRALQYDGFQVLGFESAEEALDQLEKLVPDLIISDITMPGLDGHAFRAEYASRFPERHTPFVFLSAHSEEAEVVQALETGADDYLIKPVSQRVLSAKVGALLRRSRRSVPTRFEGELGQLTGLQVLQFCERRGLTGDVELKTSKGEVTIGFVAGVMKLDRSDSSEEELQLLLALDAGSFAIVSRPLDFEELLPVAAPAPRPPASTQELPPMGKLSGVRLGERLVQVQTEFVGSPSNQIVTIVMFDGRVIHQHRDQATVSSVGELSTQLEQQHAKVEQLISRRAEVLLQRKTLDGDEEEIPRDAFLERGLESYRRGDLVAAVETLRDALGRYPEDRLVHANLKLLERKLASQHA
jgi:DNA-binding response OmpR family regulator